MAHVILYAACCIPILRNHMQYARVRILAVTIDVL
jgi:hypothetical protein